jgi:ATP/maltotriose-dependent transcriptional regulator MalT
MGRLGEAPEHADELADIAARVGTDPMRAAGCLSHGLLAAARGELDLARTCLEDATDYYDRDGAPFEASRARLELATTLAALGRREQAEREALQALAALESVGAAMEAARAAAIVRQINPASGSRAELQDGSGLSPREIEVLELLAGGMSNHEIAESLVLSVRTVERHISTIYEKLGITGRAARAAATAYAIKRGLA